MNIRSSFTLIIPLVLALLVGSSVARAEEQAAASTSPAAAGGHGGHHMETDSPAEQQTGEAAQPGQDGSINHCLSQPQKHLPQQDEIAALVSQLRAEMAAIKTTIVPENRKSLIQAHLVSMSQALRLLKDTGCGRMMQENKCPMMGGMQHAPGKEGGGKPDTAHHGMMGQEHGQVMAMCHRMMQEKAELTNSLLEQLIELQVLQWAEAR